MGVTVQVKAPASGKRAKRKVVSYVGLTDAELRELLDERGAKTLKKSATRGDLVKAMMMSELGANTVELADNMPD